MFSLNHDLRSYLRFLINIVLIILISPDVCLMLFIKKCNFVSYVLFLLSWTLRLFPDLVSISPCLCHYVQVCLVNYLHFPVYLVPVCSVCGLCQYCTCACLPACGFTFLWIN